MGREATTREVSIASPNDRLPGQAEGRGNQGGQIQRRSVRQSRRESNSIRHSSPMYVELYDIIQKEHIISMIEIELSFNQVQMMNEFLV